MFAGGFLITTINGNGASFKNKWVHVLVLINERISEYASKTYTLKPV